MVEEGLWQATAQEMLPMLYKIALGLLRHQADAQDAVQQALLKAWEKRAVPRPETFRGYLARILINECHNIQRLRQRITPVEEMPCLAAEPAEVDTQALYAAINALPEALRLPLWLKYLNDFSEKEGAQALGLTVPTFKSRLHRARKALRKTLDREVLLG